MKNYLPLFCLFYLCTCSKQEKGIQEFDEEKSVIIAGHIVNALPSLKLIKLAINRIGFNQESIETEVDSSGGFQFRFSTYVPTDAWLVYQTNFLIVTYPGDSLYIEFEGGSDNRVEVLNTIRFGGSSSDINRESAEFQKRYYKTSLFNCEELKEKAIKKCNPSQFKAFEDSLNLEGKKFMMSLFKTLLQRKK